MSVCRAQIEHLRSFVATPRCMSYETIRSLDDILDNLEAASAEVAALRRQVEELQAGKRSGIVTSWGYTSETPRRMIATVSANDRAPSVDVVTVPREYLEMLQSAANRFCSSCRDNNETCTMTSRHFGGTGCGAWKLDGTRINALRSGEAGKGAT